MQFGKWDKHARKMTIHLNIISSLDSTGYACIGCEHSKRWDMLSQLFNVYNLMMHSI